MSCLSVKVSPKVSSTQQELIGLALQANGTKEPLHWKLISVIKALKKFLHQKPIPPRRQDGENAHIVIQHYVKSPSVSAW